MQLKNHYATRGQVTTDRLVPAWFAPVVVLALAGAMLLTAALAKADAPTLADRVAALVPGFGSKKVELVDAQEFGAAVDTACKHDRECAVRLTAMAVAESALSRDVSLGVYTEHQGDSYRDKDGTVKHRAWSLWQLHSNAHNASVFGSTELLTQARAAKAAQLGALAECRAFREVSSEVGMWRVLSGRGCLYHYSGEEKRMQLLAKIRGRL